MYIDNFIKRCMFIHLLLEVQNVRKGAVEPPVYLTHFHFVPQNTTIEICTLTNTAVRIIYHFYNCFKRKKKERVTRCNINIKDTG